MLFWQMYTTSFPEKICTDNRDKLFDIGSGSNVVPLPFL